MLIFIRYRINSVWRMDKQQDLGSQIKIEMQEVKGFIHDESMKQIIDRIKKEGTIPLPDYKFKISGYTVTHNQFGFSYTLTVVPTEPIRLDEIYEKPSKIY